jgi:hypothetical protein
MPTQYHDSIMVRYRDAYLVSRAIIGVGTVIKGIAIAVAFVVVLAGLILTQGIGLVTGMAVMIGGILQGALFYLIGILLSALGEIQKATLDTAVNSSPFLDHEQRATIMSLTKGPSVDTSADTDEYECEDCGATVSEHATVCAKCGAELTETTV